MLTLICSNVLKKLDEALYDALQQCIKGEHSEVILGKITDAKCFGEGRTAIEVLDKHFHHSDAAAALAATQQIFRLKCPEMRKAEVTMQNFRDLRTAMGQKENKMTDALGISSLRNAFGSIKEIEGVISTHRASKADGASLQPLIEALDSRSAEWTGENQRGNAGKLMVTRDQQQHPQKTKQQNKQRQWQDVAVQR